MGILRHASDFLFSLDSIKSIAFLVGAKPQEDFLLSKNERSAAGGRRSEGAVCSGRSALVDMWRSGGESSLGADKF